MAATMTATRTWSSGDFLVRLRLLPTTTLLATALMALAPAAAGAVEPAEAATPTGACCGHPRAAIKAERIVLQRGSLTLDPHARVELRAALLTGEDNQRNRGDLAEQVGFAVPRARIGARGRLREHVRYAVITDLAAAQSGALAGAGGPLTDAWIGYERYRFLKMWFGVMTVPFSYSALLSSADTGLSERSRSSDAMAPFRQVGVTVGGDYCLAGLSWRAGVYNGFDRNMVFYQGIESPAGLRGNRFHGLAAVARLQAQPLGKVGDEVADLAGGDLRLSLGGGGYWNDSGSAWMTGYSADLHVKVRGFHLLAEWIRDSAAPVDQPTTGSTLPETIRRQAISAELGYTWGRLGLAARADLVDPNLDVQNNDDELWLSGALTWHFVANQVRAQLQYDHRRERSGVPLANDTLLAKLLLRY